MTYNVFGGTLNLAQSIKSNSLEISGSTVLLTCCILWQILEFFFGLEMLEIYWKCAKSTGHFLTAFDCLSSM